MADPQQHPGLHPDSVAYLKIMAENKAGSIDSMSPDDARKFAVLRSKTLAGVFDFDGTRSDIMIPSATNGIPAWVYKPSSAGQDPVILVYFHGGGMVVGSRETHDVACKHIASLSNCIVVNVEYRLGPEHMFPASFDDAVTAVQWTLQNKEVVGGSSKSKVGVGGDSAGGALTIACCHEVPGVDFQILIYPSVNKRGEYPSDKEMSDLVLTQELMAWFQKHFYNNPEEMFSVRASGIFRESFDGQPPVLFIVASHDPLRDHSIEYAKKLTAAGVPNETLMLDGLMHGFFSMPGHFKEPCGRAYTKIAEFIKQQCAK